MCSEPWLQGQRCSSGRIIKGRKKSYCKYRSSRLLRPFGYISLAAAAVSCFCICQHSLYFSLDVSPLHAAIQLFNQGGLTLKFWQLKCTTTWIFSSSSVTFHEIHKDELQHGVETKMQHIMSCARLNYKWTHVQTLHFKKEKSWCPITDANKIKSNQSVCIHIHPTDLITRRLISAHLLQ